MKNIKCLAISNSYPPDHAGGYELGAFNVLESLSSECGWRNSIFASVRKKKSPLTADTVLTGFFPGRLGPEIELINTKRAVVRNTGAINSALKEAVDEADVVFIFNPRRLILPQWTTVLNAGKPVFLLISDFWPQDPYGSDIFYSRSKKQNGELRELKLREIYRTVPALSKFFGEVAGVVMGSHFMKNAHAESLAMVGNKCVAHWGIEVGKFPAIPFSKDRLRTVGFCGRPEQEKGLDLAIDAFRDLALEMPDLTLRIASDLKGSLFGRSLLKRINYDPILKERVTLLGHVAHDELHAKLYSQIGILLFPSVWDEPFALTVLEAMSSGSIVVGSNTGGTPEVVDDEAGYLFDPKKEGALIEVFRQAVAPSESNRLKAESAVKRILETHTIKSMAKKIDGFVRGSV